MNIGVDLLWVRPGKNGGGESYIRNILDGFINNPTNDIAFSLFVSKDNVDSFSVYEKEGFSKLILCNINSKEIAKRILWQNFFLDRKAIENMVDLMFIPVYSKPITSRSIPYVTTIHDLQAFHFPNYFSFLKKIWLRYSWYNSIRSSEHVVAISEFVKNDIIKFYPAYRNKISVIYNLIRKTPTEVDFSLVSQKYELKNRNYFYTVSSLAPHKNMKVLLDMMDLIKKNRDSKIPNLMLISGIGKEGKEGKDFAVEINKKGLEKNVILTGFVSNEERDALYANCYAFLFPSIFEGFGMPPIEAMMHGAPVITTRCSCLPEVTQNRACYVNNYEDAREWLQLAVGVKETARQAQAFPEYATEVVTKKYLNIFRQVVSSKRKRGVFDATV